MKLLTNIFRDEKAGAVVSKLEWLAAREYQVRAQNGSVSLEVFGIIDGTRVRRCDGHGKTILEAIQDAQNIIAEQDRK
jgi:hypothetical protein